ncbi:MAG: hypothetical protein H6746_19675 [Deltaproteobacteria bacterium]|nr:hypothetical protein [Deltaproteobacteria bacterium]
MGAGGRRSRRIKVTAERPLRLHGSVDRDEPYLSLGARLVAPVAQLFARWPTWRDTRSGRQGAWVVRGVILVAAVALGVRLPWPVGDVVGLAVACLALVLPMEHLRHARRLARLRALAAPRARSVAVPAALHYDGQKLTVTAEERVWRSMRAEASAARVVAGEAEGGRWLGLAPPGRSDRELLWCRAPLGPWAAAPSGRLDAAPAAPPLRLGVEDFDTLCAVFLDPPAAG